MRSLAEAIIGNAQKWTGCKENPNTPNRSACVDEIKKLYDPNRDPKNEAWCAEFVSVILMETLPLYLVIPPFFKTRSTTEMVKKARANNVPFTNYPVVGSTFFYARQGAGGHVGFVKSVVYDTKKKIIGFNTIEGNTKIPGTSYEGVGEHYRKVDSKYLYMNFQKLSSLKMPTPKELGGWAIGGAMIIGAGYTYYKFEQDIKNKIKKYRKSVT